MGDERIRIDAPTVAAVIDDLRFAVNYHETYGISRIANAARAAIEALEAKERQGDPLDGYHPMVRDFILGQGCFSQEEQIEAARRVGEKIGKAAAEAMNEALLEAFAPALDLAQTPGRKCDNPGDDSISSAGANARVAELESAPAASGAAGTDAVGYAVKQGKFYSQHLHANYGDAWGVAGKGTVVPLYTAPPPARGWLTEEEREAVEAARATFSLGCAGMPEDGGWYKLHKRRQDSMLALLARSSPPEVVLPTVFQLSNLGDPLVALEQVKAALAAAGVNVKVVGR